MKKHLLAAYFFTMSFVVMGQNPFVTIWKTTNPGISVNNQISIPGVGSNYKIKWEKVGNPTINDSLVGNQTTLVTFPDTGTYKVSIFPPFNGINFWFDAGDTAKLLEVLQFGDIAWTKFRFVNCARMDIKATDIPDFSNLNSLDHSFLGCNSLKGPSNINLWNTSNVLFMDLMFYGAKNFNQPIGNWNTSNVISMPYMFYDACTFNQPIGNWNTGNVNNMSSMFWGASSFNQPIETWNTSNVANMSLMFAHAIAFNQPIGFWNTINVTNMSSMFGGANSFNQPINNWNLSNVSNMASMFAAASSFNQPINDWNVSNVSNLGFIFYNAISFNQNLSNWTLKAGANLTQFFFNSPIDCDNYQNTLRGWKNNPLTPNNLTFNPQGVRYSKAVKSTRDSLINQKGWTINGDFQLGNNCIMQPFVTIWKTDNPGSSLNTQITIPGLGSNYPIQWENVNNPAINGTTTGNDATTITFPSPGTYKVSILPPFYGINFWFDSGDTAKLIEVQQFGDIEWSDFRFYNCARMNITATDMPDFSKLYSLRFAFYGCRGLNGPTNINSWNTSNIKDMFFAFKDASIFNQHIGNWNTSSVTNMGGMFGGAHLFNQTIGNWNVSNVTDMSGMFESATNFNQAIGNWNTGKVTNMSGMFGNAMNFNQHIGNWNTNSVTNMGGMFSGASLFNQPIGNWNTISVINTNGMFQDAISFNQPIENWNTSNVTNMVYMFLRANSFNRPLNIWDVSQVSSFYGMFEDAISFNQNLGNWTFKPGVNLSRFFMNTPIDCDNYQNTLRGWKNNPLTPNNLTFGPYGVRYSKAVKSTRDSLINQKGWTINGDYQLGNNCMLQPFVTIWKTDNPGASLNTQITIPGLGSNYPIQWENVNDPSINGITIGNNATTVTFPSPGTYKVSILPPFYGINFWFNSGDTAKLIEVQQFGDIAWSNFRFVNCARMNITATDIPDFSNLSYLGYAFYGCHSLTGPTNINNWNIGNIQSLNSTFANAEVFNQPINNWNTANVTDMAACFSGAKVFNQPIGSWTTSKVTNMIFMFSGALAFNQNLENWNTSNVTNMQAMFNDASNFNQPIGLWNTSNVIDISFMFDGASMFNQPIGNWNTFNVSNMFAVFGRTNSFNQPIGNWNTTNVTNMGSMFNGASAFNQPIENWNTVNVTNMSGMFGGASLFNQPIGNWEVSNVSDLSYMFYNGTSFNQNLDNWRFKPGANLTQFFYNTGIDCENYDKTLIGWNRNPLMTNNLSLTISGPSYWTSTCARDSLINQKGWTISGDSYQNCNYTIPARTATTNNTTNNWSNPRKWDGCIVPRAIDTVVINHSTILPNSYNAQAKSVNNTSSLTIQPSGTLHLSGTSSFALRNIGTLTNSGTITIQDAPSYGIINENGGVITNLGGVSINNPANFGILNRNVGTTLNNNGTITIQGGTLKNEDQAILNIIGLILLQN